MAHEITPWKEPGCELTLEVGKFSNRETYSREINEEYGEGGGLNANYRTVEAIAKVANILGLKSLRYGIHFVFKTGGGDKVIFDFCNKIIKEDALRILRENGVVTI